MAKLQIDGKDVADIHPDLAAGLLRLGGVPAWVSGYIEDRSPPDAAIPDHLSQGIKSPEVRELQVAIRFAVDAAAF